MHKYKIKFKLLFIFFHFNFFISAFLYLYLKYKKCSKKLFLIMENRHIIIDNGSGFYKDGFSGELGPRTVFPSIFERPKNKLIMITGHQKDFYIGLDAEEIRSILNLNY